MLKIKVTDEGEMGKILDLVHDRIFQLSDVSFQEQDRTVCIPLTVISDTVLDERKRLFVSTWANPIVEAVLIIGKAIGFLVKDQAHIGETAINTMRVEEDYLVLKCSPPVEIRVSVESLDLQLALSDKTVGKVSRISMGPPRTSRHP